MKSARPIRDRVNIRASLRAGIWLVAFWSAVVPVASAALAETLLLAGDQGYSGQVIKQPEAQSDIDAQTAVFRVANSGVSNPSTANPCDSGPLPTNHYPLQIRESAGLSLRGGMFAGEVPLTSDWRATYCNSAAVALRDSPAAVISGVRMRRVWDGVRFSEGSTGFQIRSSWLSEARDDCIENDFMNGGVVEDLLLDGCFSGLSMRPPKGAAERSAAETVVLRGVLMRMQPYLYREELRHGSPFKVDASAPQIEVYDSIVAMDDPGMVSKLRLAIGWTKIGNCSGNLLLWTADTPWPDALDKPPGCFRLVQGAEARALWTQARQNWIDCHPKMARFPDDPASDVTNCTADMYGGNFANSQ